MRSKTLLIGSLAMIGALVLALALLRRSVSEDRTAEILRVYAAAGLKGPLDAVFSDYERYMAETRGRPFRVEVQYAGSGTLLSLLAVSPNVDLLVTGDESFILLGREQGLIREAIPLAVMTPVLAVAKGRELPVGSLEDLIDSGLRIGIGMPDGTAIGALTRNAVQQRGNWEGFLEKVTVIKPTVNDLASDLRIGSLDVAVIFDSIAHQYGLDFVHDPALDAQSAQVMAGVVEQSARPAAALHLARFMGAPEKGLAHFESAHFDVVEGDRWTERPEVMLFSGAINRRAMDAVLAEFEQREGVRVNTVFQGCGALTAQMRAMEGQRPEQGFPDGYLACDVYYLDPVADWFTHKATVSSTRIVIVTARGNPKNIRGLEDLAQPGLRVVLGHPTHCTIGALSDRLLRASGLYERIIPNVVERQPSSGMMVPPVLSGAADASLAYYTDTQAERDRLTVIELVEEHGEFARAAQPFGVSVQSPNRLLLQRLYEHIGRSQPVFESLGFSWEFGRDPSEFSVIAPEGARPHDVPREDPGE